MSKIKIPLKWYSDLIPISKNNNEYLLLEWFEEKDCKNKTLWCLGKYLKVSQYQIIETDLKGISSNELTKRLFNNKLNFIKLGEYIQENILYCPEIYFLLKRITGLRRIYPDYTSIISFRF